MKIQKKLLLASCLLMIITKSWIKSSSRLKSDIHSSILKKSDSHFDPAEQAKQIAALIDPSYQTDPQISSKHNSSISKVSGFVGPSVLQLHLPPRTFDRSTTQEACIKKSKTDLVAKFSKLSKSLVDDMAQVYTAAAVADAASRSYSRYLVSPDNLNINRPIEYLGSNRKDIVGGLELINAIPANFNRSFYLGTQTLEFYISMIAQQYTSVPRAVIENYVKAKLIAEQSNQTVTTNGLFGWGSRTIKNPIFTVDKMLEDLQKFDTEIDFTDRSDSVRLDAMLLTTDKLIKQYKEPVNPTNISVPGLLVKQAVAPVVEELNTIKDKAISHLNEGSREVYNATQAGTETVNNAINTTARTFSNAQSTVVKGVNSNESVDATPEEVSPSLDSKITTTSIESIDEELPTQVENKIKSVTKISQPEEYQAVMDAHGPVVNNEVNAAKVPQRVGSSVAQTEIITAPSSPNNRVYDLQTKEAIENQAGTYNKDGIRNDRNSQVDPRQAETDAATNLTKPDQADQSVSVDSTHAQGSQASTTLEQVANLKVPAHPRDQTILANQLSIKAQQAALPKERSSRLVAINNFIKSAAQQVANFFRMTKSQEIKLEQTIEENAENNSNLINAPESNFTQAFSQWFTKVIESARSIVGPEKQK